ncbi:hypothetical protein CCACVL1_26738 [Corchorus capsularis]|uniref:Uncharacterized protein n=1 Tax=Corchorus capsularis TaxID=210143 RepID=A0A1R3GDH1_COCAP|nr:hypothetical protein CCACVL1_26738 [Corchorus capsularis]
MEELRKLEQLQRTLTFMQSRNFNSSSSNDSNRFLASLILLLLQPCGELNLENKCSLISEYMPKISATFLEEASEWVSLEADEKGQFLFIFPLLRKRKLDYKVLDFMDCGSLKINREEVAMVGLEAMERANSTLEDFCRSYFMFHGMEINIPQMVFKYLPVLSFTESYIYQLDNLNEKITYIPTEGVTALGFEKVKHHGWAADVFEKDPFSPLLNLLECRGLLTERIREELSSGEEYWALERKLCCALMCKMEISVEDVMRAIHLKSFDYRVLNLLLYQLRGEEVNDLHMEFLSVSEFLVEISDDLFDYEDDVLENSFNILRMFVKIYGPSRAPAMLAKYITDAEEKYDNLLKALNPQLSSKYQRRCEEATKEGGKISGHPLGTWSIPPVIVNEDLYRSNCLKY